jgi:hypothetical protein
MTLKSSLCLQTSIFPSITPREDSEDDFFIESLTPKGYPFFYARKCAFNIHSPEKIGLPTLFFSDNREFDKLNGDCGESLPECSGKITAVEKPSNLLALYENSPVMHPAFYYLFSPIP